MLSYKEGCKLGKGLSTDILLLAAGTSSRMDGTDKLLKEINGTPIIRYMANIALESNAKSVHVVLGHNSNQREKCLTGLKIRTYFYKDYHNGLGASISFGIKRISSSANSVIILLADMPKVKSGDLNKLIESYSTDLKREICIATNKDGVQGHPVLFGSKFFMQLVNLKGDKGAKRVLNEHSEFVWPVITSGDTAVFDIDTEEDWRKFENHE